MRHLRLKISGNPAPPSRNARKWSNQELRKLAHGFTGDVINVSAWRDQDKEGHYYREYFPNAGSYTISNYEGWRGVMDQEADGLVIDLTKDLPQKLQGAFDVVLNHTTLEHVYQIEKAFENLCSMSRDIVIIVVPFVQELHGPDGLDFWRFSPFSLRRLYQDNGFSVIYESAGPPNDRTTYLFFVASREPGRWRAILNSASNDDAWLRDLRTPAK